MCLRFSLFLNLCDRCLKVSLRSFVGFGQPSFSYWFRCYCGSCILSFVGICLRSFLIRMEVDSIHKKLTGLSTYYPQTENFLYWFDDGSPAWMKNRLTWMAHQKMACLWNPIENAFRDYHCSYNIFVEIPESFVSPSSRKSNFSVDWLAYLFIVLKNY